MRKTTASGRKSPENGLRGATIKSFSQLAWERSMKGPTSSPPINLPISIRRSHLFGDGSMLLPPGSADGLHVWNLPGGPPSSQIEIDLIFRDLFGPAVFSHLPKNADCVDFDRQRFDDPERVSAKAPFRFDHRDRP